MKVIFFLILAASLKSTLSLSINSTKSEEEKKSLDETTSTTTTERSIEEIKRQEYQRALAQNKALNGKHFHNGKMLQVLK